MQIWYPSINSASAQGWQLLHLQESKFTQKIAIKGERATPHALPKYTYQRIGVQGTCLPMHRKVRRRQEYGMPPVASIRVLDVQPRVVSMCGETRIHFRTLRMVYFQTLNLTANLQILLRCWNGGGRLWFNVEVSPHTFACERRARSHEASWGLMSLVPRLESHRMANEYLLPQIPHYDRTWTWTGSLWLEKDTATTPTSSTKLWRIFPESVCWSTIKFSKLLELTHPHVSFIRPIFPHNQFYRRP